jgi:hypothetical protein
MQTITTILGENAALIYKAAAMMQGKYKPFTVQLSIKAQY